MKKSEETQVIQQLRNSELFGMFGENELKRILDAYQAEVKRYKRGDIIFSKNGDAESIGLLIKGSAQVSKGEGTHTVVMSKLEQGNVFGLAYLFSKNDYFVTDITALNDCNVVFLPKEMIKYLLKEYDGFAENYIAYLSSRIYFLNDRIESFTGATAKERVWKYIYDRADENGIFSLNIKLSTLAKALNLGRASLYRALDELESEDKIERKDTKTIICKEKMK